MNKYIIWNIIWAITPRPLYKGKPTRSYQKLCLDMNLPFPSAHFLVESETSDGIVTGLARKYNTPIYSVKIQKTNFVYGPNEL